MTLAAPRFIHLNGPPGIGKSTLARMYVDDHFGVLNLDLDALRALIGGSQDCFDETGEIVRSLALAMARTHLQAGRDVVMPQYLGSLSEIDRFEAAALESDARFCEVVLMDTKDRSIERFDRRGQNEELPWHRQVQAIVRRGGGSALLADMYDRLTEVVGARPNAIVVPSVAGAVQQTYGSLALILESGRGSRPATRD